MSHQQAFRFDGPTLTHADSKRLGIQLEKVRALVIQSGWLTLSQIASITGYPEASVSARLRQLRSLGHQVDRRRVPETNGLHEYRVSKPGATHA